MKAQKTQENDGSVEDFINRIEIPNRHQEAWQLLSVFEEATGVKARMWGDSIIGFGSYRYQYASGHQGYAASVGFSPRKTKISLYITLPQEEKERWLKKLGKVTSGVSCIYVNKLADIDLEVLKEIIQVGWETIENIYPDLGDGGRL